MLNLKRNPEGEEGGDPNPQEPPQSATSHSPQPPASPSIVKSGRKSSPKEERELQERLAAMEDKNQQLTEQLTGIQKQLSEFGKTNKGKGFMDSFREFLGWDE